jgi:cell wall-associated NlpC family hydrolase
MVEASVRSVAGLCIALLLLAGCASEPAKVAKPSPTLLPAVRYALSLQGTPYRYGKDSPDEGFDCSGFVQHVYRAYGIPLPRTVREMAGYLSPIAFADRRPGDLLFFSLDGRPYSHVGIYVGSEDFVHAPSSHTGHVIVSSLRREYWARRLVGVRRPMSAAYQGFSRQEVLN